MRMRLLLAASLLSLAGHAALAAHPVADARTGCRVFVPEAWTRVSIQWHGACPGGLAAGPGALAARAGGKLQESFFGDMAAGRMTGGVFVDSGGFRPARFTEGEPEDTSDRNEIIAAFRTAANAARRASERFRASGNPESARYHARMAQRLENQMD